ncbi:MAG TPA: hypothetical protein VF502_19690 [Stellaceae bacterium]
MDREQVVEQIDGIDRQILHLTQSMRPIGGHPTDGDRIEHGRWQQEVRRLAVRKAELRLELVRA